MTMIDPRRKEHQPGVHPGQTHNAVLLRNRSHQTDIDLLCGIPGAAFRRAEKGLLLFLLCVHIAHLEIAALLPQHLPAEAIKLMAYGFHLGNREHLSSSPPLSGREAGFFFSLSIPMTKGGFGQFSSNFLKEI